ncbi:MAG: hypothetical protein AAB425_09690, partial [Bdellovibrionota bacterium]
ADLGRVEGVAHDLTIYEIKASGQLPPTYQRDLRAKLERVLLTSSRIKVHECRGCDEARLLKNENGEILYESTSSDRDRVSKLVASSGATHFISAELGYSTEELSLRVKVTEATSGTLQWTKTYSASEIVAQSDSNTDTGAGDLHATDGLSRALIGEIAFQTVISPGFFLTPSVASGGSSSLVANPSLDIVLGEKYAGGHRAFGFLVGGVIGLGPSPKTGTNIPWLLRIAPQFKYFFNPENVTTARYGITGEAGGIVSTGLVTGYLGAGPEVSMIRRFSVTLLPMYIFSATVAGAQQLEQQTDGSFKQKQTAPMGTFGGFAMSMKVNINW